MCGLGTRVYIAEGWRRSRFNPEVMEATGAMEYWHFQTEEGAIRLTLDRIHPDLGKLWIADPHQRSYEHTKALEATGLVHLVTVQISDLVSIRRWVEVPK